MKTSASPSRLFACAVFIGGLNLASIHYTSSDSWSWSSVLCGLAVPDTAIKRRRAPTCTPPPLPQYQHRRKLFAANQMPNDWLPRDISLAVNFQVFQECTVANKKLCCRAEAARLCVPVVSFNSTIPRVHSFIISYIINPSSNICVIFTKAYK